MAKIAGGQHGNVTRKQLLAAGVSGASVGRWCDKGLLHAEFRGVYRVGHRAPNVLARYAAAVLACGEGAALCGAAAAWVYGLLRGKPPAPEVVTTKHRSVRGVVVHRARELADEDISTWQGIRLTTIPRTIVDLAATLSLDALARLHHDARIRFRIQPEAIEEVLRKRPKRKGSEGLRAVIHGDTPLLLSRLERGFRAWLSAEHLPLPQTNRKEGAHWVDCHFREHNLVVELDSFRFHNDRKTWETDRQRERDARSRGQRFRRFTWRDVFEDQRYMRAELTRLLARATARRAAAG